MTLIRHHSLISTRQQQITYLGTSGIETPGATATLVPPTGTRAGDLVYIYAGVGSSGTRNFSITTTGGQSWTTNFYDSGTIPQIWVSWAVFNGTWSASPVVGIDGTAVSKAYIMFVFRAPKISASWSADASANSFSAATDTHTISGITNTNNKTVTIGAMSCGASTFTGHTSVGWVYLGQFGQSGPNARTLFFFYKVQGYRYAMGATGNITLTTDVTTTPYNVLRGFGLT